MRQICRMRMFSLPTPIHANALMPVEGDIAARYMVLGVAAWIHAIDRFGQCVCVPRDFPSKICQIGHPPIAMKIVPNSPPRAKLPESTLVRSWN